MGVLDDAIREHLELKRQHGARDSEIKQLEDQAFGPPSRPGEPDFPESANGGEQAAGEADAPQVVAEQPPLVQPEAATPEAGEAAPPFDIERVQQDTQPFDAAAHIEAEAAGESAPPAPPVAEPEPVEDEGVEEEPDQAMDEDLGVADLDLKLDEEPAEHPIQDVAQPPAPEREPEPLAQEPTAPAHEEVGPAEEAAEPPPETKEQPYPPEDVLEESDELELSLDEETGEDVLEETPEFLRDAPDDEELWFEQGEPQDFDFEDEDDA